MSSILDALERARRERERQAGQPAGVERARTSSRGGQSEPSRGAAVAQPAAPTVASSAAEESTAASFQQPAPGYAPPQAWAQPPVYHAPAPPQPQPASARATGSYAVPALLLFLVVGGLAAVSIFLAYRLGSQDRQSVESRNAAIVAPAPVAASIEPSAADRDVPKAKPESPSAPESPPIEESTPRPVVVMEGDPRPPAPPRATPEPRPQQPKPARAPQTFDIHVEDFEDLSISGVFEDGEETFVLISGREQLIGDTVRGYRIEGITERTVILKKDGDTYNIRY